MDGNIWRALLFSVRIKYHFLFPNVLLSCCQAFKWRVSNHNFWWFWTYDISTGPNAIRVKKQRWDGKTRSLNCRGKSQSLFCTVCICKIPIKKWWLDTVSYDFFCHGWTFFSFVIGHGINMGNYLANCRDSLLAYRCCMQVTDSYPDIQRPASHRILKVMEKIRPSLCTDSRMYRDQTHQLEQEFTSY